MKPRGVPWLAPAAIVLLTILAYAPLRHGRFFQDDHPIVQLNPVVHRGDWREIMTTDYWAGVGGSEQSLYRPVTIASFALERGPDDRVPPARAHVTNIFLHAGVALALWGLALRLRAGSAAAFSAGLIFALHPIHLSVVAGLVGRAEILAAGFTLLALLSWTRAGEWREDGRYAPSAGAVAPRLAACGCALFVFLALGSKESALAAPALLVAADLAFRTPRAGEWKRWCIERGAALAPSALAVTVYAMMRTHAIGIFPGTQRPRLADNLLVELDGVERLATALSLAGRAFGLLVWPARLSADYSGPVIRTQTSILSPLPLLGTAFLACAGWYLLAPLLRRARSNGDLASRRRSVAAALFLLPYLVVGNLLVLVGIVFAERLLYLPSIGFCLAAGLAVGALLRGRSWAARAAVAIACVTLLAGPVVLWVRTRTADWLSDATVWEASARATPDSPRALFTLAKIRLEQGRDEEALALFSRTVELWPAYSAAWLERGTIAERRGEPAEALRCFREAVRRNPWNPEAAAGAARLAFERQQFAESERYYRRAIRFGRSDLVPRWREAAARAL